MRRGIFPINSLVCGFQKSDVAPYKRAPGSPQKAGLGRFRESRRGWPGPEGGVRGRLGGRLPSTGRGPAPPTHAPRQRRQSCHAGALSLGLVAGCRHPIPPDLGPSDNKICGIKSGPQIFPAPHHGQSLPASSPQPPGPRGLAGPPAAPNPPRAWTGGLPPELQLGAGRHTSPTRQIIYHLPGKAHLGASMGASGGSPTPTAPHLPGEGPETRKPPRCTPATFVGSRGPERRWSPGRSHITYPAKPSGRCPGASQGTVPGRCARPPRMLPGRWRAWIGLAG